QLADNAFYILLFKSRKIGFSHRQSINGTSSLHDYTINGRLFCFCCMVLTPALLHWERSAAAACCTWCWSVGLCLRPEKAMVALSCSASWWSAYCGISFQNPLATSSIDPRFVQSPFSRGKEIVPPSRK